MVALENCIAQVQPMVALEKKPKIALEYPKIASEYPKIALENCKARLDRHGCSCSMQ